MGSTVCFVGFLYLLGSVNIMGDVHGSHFSFCTLCIFAFLGILAVFAHIWGFNGNLCLLRAIVSYKVTRWIKLVVGRVIKGLWEGSQGFWGGL